MTTTHHLGDATTDAPEQPSQRIGLLAAWGRYPIVVAEELKRQGHQVYCLGITGLADPSLADICDDFQPIGCAKLGAQIRYFRRHGVRRATMAGKIHKVAMFQPFAVLRHLPDWRCLRVYYPHFILGTKDRKDDTLLGTLVGEYAKDGIEFAPATDFAPQLLIKKGQLVGRRLSSSQWSDICLGWEMAKKLGELDIGQSVAVKGRAVLAVEAVEGTDACIRRAGELCTAGGFTVVKVAKPRQDMRFDVPAIGLGTIETIAAAGGSLLAVEADRTIVIDQARVVELAATRKVSIVAVHDPAVDRNTRLAAA
ncbi:MAG: LpxI family protein [Planctomycetota bacterium]|nr:MAG: LpxI family protein [Planctomycetota bacterium]REJ96110.1 MAG: LpxI family protein [Planctomycetota bacterium]REK21882.1 MAG: LpxI family protein [Planctomycetota bacterium]REK46690.1 MAG: LpxI family protein [Planctomycetota bacterium]